jgi:4-amino-4-deoxy-L-arabinose transferase-like glycosyltransferase
MAAGAAVRLVLWIWFQHLPIQIHDEKDYNLLATNLLEYRQFAYTAGTPASLRPPLYPLIVAGVYALCGLDSFQAVRLLQAALNLVNVLVLYGLGKEVGSRQTALWLAGLFCFYPSFLGFNNLLLTETLFTLLLCAFCYFVALAYTRGALVYLALAGISFSLATLTRSILWLSLPVLAAFLLVTWQAAWPRRALALLALLVPLAATLAPWAWRTSMLEKTFVAVDTMGGRNFMMGNYRYTPLYRAWDAISITGEKSWDHEVLSANPHAENPTQGQLDKLALQHGMNFVVNHPWLTVQRDIIKFFDFWGLERELIAGAGLGYFGAISTLGMVVLAVVICGVYIASLFLGIFGFLLAPLDNRRLHWFLFGVIAYICGIHTLVFGHSRYHVPVMPLVLVFTASAITAQPAIWRQWRRGRFWLATSLCLLVAFGWLWNMAAGDLARIRQYAGDFWAS